MMTLEELRENWREMIAALDQQVAAIDGGSRIRSAGSDITPEWRAKLVGWREELEVLSREGDSIA